MQLYVTRLREHAKKKSKKLVGVTYRMKSLNDGRETYITSGYV